MAKLLHSRKWKPIPKTCPRCSGTGHITEQRPANVEDRFWNKVAVGKPDECWEWQGARLPLGYGLFCFQGRSQRASRMAYIFRKGPIPEGLVLDHLCRNPPCVNPSHLEAVTQQENFKRSPITHAVKRRTATHCPKGHSYAEHGIPRFKRSNQRWSRKCTVCQRASEQRYQQKRKKAA